MNADNKEQLDTLTITNILGVYVIRAITIVATILLATSTIVNAEDRKSSLLNPGFNPYHWGFKQQHLHRVDMKLSPREYEWLYSRNRRFVRNNLIAYSRDALESIGIPEQGVNLMGTALGVVINGAKLDLNKSKTLALEFKDVSDQERTLYFGVNLDW